MTVKQKYLYWFAFVLGLILLTFIQYYGLIHFNYIVPPGDDGANHLGMAMSFYENKTTIFEYLRTGTYPPAYHIFLAKAAHLFNNQPLDIMLWTYPATLILSGLAVFILTYFTFGSTPALISFYIYSFTSRTPIQLLNDGGYPNLIAGHFLLPITFTFLILADRSENKRKFLYWFLSFLSSMLLFATHHISTFYLITILIVFIPSYYLILSLLNKNTKQTAVSTTIYLFILTLLIIAFKNMSLFTPARELASLMFASIDVFPYFRFTNHLQTPEAIIRISEIPTRIGRLATVTGIIGLVCLPFIFKREIKKYLYSILLLFVWILILLFGSQMTFLTNPERVARDLAVPLSVTAGTAIYFAWKQIKQSKNNYAVKLLLFFVLISFCGFSQVRDRIKNSFQYEPMVRYTEADYIALKHPSDNNATVLIYSYNFYVPFINKDLLFQNAYETDPSLRNDPEYINQFDYVYIVNQQAGWTPKDVQFGLADIYHQKPDYNLIIHKTTRINDVFLFQKK